MSRRDKELSTEASWQAPYILWTRIIDLPEPCGGYRGYKQIIIIYIKFLQYGVNYTSKDGLQAATLIGYAKAISILFTLQGFPAPFNPSDPNNMGGIIITNHAREEDIAIQRYPLSLEILAKLGTMAESSSSVDAKQNLIFDITCLGRFISPRVTEYAQTSPNKVDYHTYPSGTKVIQAFIANNFVFYNTSGTTIDLVDTAYLD